MKRVLIVVDMQNDFVTGPLGTPEAKAIIPKVREKIDNFENELVFFTRDTHKENYMDTQEGKFLPVPHCIEGTEGWEIIPELFCSIGSYINKGSFGYTYWQYELYHFANEIDTIELCGVCTDICVVSNALILKALYPEKRIIVDSAACAGVTPEKHEAALEVMRSCQIEVL